MLIITAAKNSTLWQSAKKLWPQAKIIDWQTALEKFCCDQRQYLLTKIEQIFIWQHCVAQHATETQSAKESLAAAAEEAFWLAKHWSIDWQALSKSTDANTQWFCSVAQIFMRYCTAHRCVDEIQLLTHAITRVRSNPTAALTTLEESQHIIFYGFLSVTPLQEKFMRALKNAPCVVEWFHKQAIKQCATPTLHIFTSLEEELDAAMDWLYQTAQKNPQQRLALVVPELRLMRDRIESKWIQKSFDSNCIALLSPKPLSEYGLIQTGLALLKIALTQTPDLNALITLLRSPYFGNMPEETIDRSSLSKKLRALQHDILTWDVIIHAAGHWPTLQQLLRICHKSRKQKKQSLASWVAHWQELWQQVGFPNYATLNKKEQALYHYFLEKLTDFTTLLPWRKSLSALQAADALQQYCHKTLWRLSEEDKRVTIFIAPVLEALHLSTDQAWLMHAYQYTIPFKLSVNPLLDKKIQYQYGIWAFNREQYDALSMACYETLQQVNKQLIISYVKETTEQNALPATFCHTLIATECAAREKIQPSMLRQKHPTMLSAWSDETLPGASAALKTQRLCSMQAFAKHRLRLSPATESVLGLTAVERGIIIHRALQLIWQQLNTQTQLLNLTSEALQQLLHRIIPIAFNTIDWSRRKLLATSVLALEQIHLTTLLTDWLALEATRPPFEIFSLEQSTDIRFAEKNWRLRVDRIDKLADGRLLLIDYKTGKTSIASWQQQLFTEPQLPLYAVTHALNIDAIAFAELSGGTLKMLGLAEHVVDLGKLGMLAASENWRRLKTEWRTKLTELTDDFVHSQASLTPLDGDNTCQQCGLHSFCRIFDSST